MSRPDGEADRNDKPLDVSASPSNGETPAAGFIRRPAGLDSIASLSVNSIVYLLGIPTSILIARALGPSGKGISTLVATIIAQGGLLSLGIESAIIYAGGRRPALLRQLTGVAIKAAAILGLVAAGIGIAVFWLVFGDSVPASVLPWAAFAMLGIPMLMLSGFLHSLLVASGRIIEASGLSSVLAGLSLVAAGTVFFLDLDVSALLMLNLVAVAIAAAVTLAWTARSRLLPVETGQQGLVRSLVSYGLKGHVGTILHGLSTRIDLLIVGVYLSTRDVGIYSISITAAETLWIFPTFLGTVVFQRASSLPSEEATRFTALTCRITTLTVAAGAIGWLVLGRLLIGLMFGEEFTGAVEPLYILLPGVLMLALWRTMTNDLMGRGHPQFKSYSAALALALTAVLSFVLIPSMGIRGAAVASTIGYASSFAVSWGLFRRETGTGLLQVLIPQRGDAAVIRASAQASLAYLRQRSSKRS